MIRFEQLESMGGIVAACSTVADGDMSMQGGGPDARRAFCAALDVPADALTCGQQVHGDTVRVVTEANRHPNIGAATAFPETDGLITQERGIPLAVLVADCVPVYLYDPVVPACGIVHAGRRGVRQAIVRKAVEGLIGAFGSQPANIRALIGPSAGPDRYEVSSELINEWVQAGLPVRGQCLDLWEANRMQLIEAGVPPEHIHVSGICTIQDGRFFSYRRQGTKARQIAVIMLR